MYTSLQVYSYTYIQVDLYMYEEKFKSEFIC